MPRSLALALFLSHARINTGYAAYLSRSHAPARESMPGKKFRSSEALLRDDSQIEAGSSRA